jgi:hypothetical protein
MSWIRLTGALAIRAARQPRLAASLVRVAWRFRSRGWYRRFPFLPVPDREYLAWRMYTAYGDAGATPPPSDVEHYARWAAR